MNIRTPRGSFAGPVSIATADVLWALILTFDPQVHDLSPLKWVNDDSFHLYVVLFWVVALGTVVNLFRQTRPLQLVVGVANTALWSYAAARLMEGTQTLLVSALCLALALGAMVRTIEAGGWRERRSSDSSS